MSKRGHRRRLFSLLILMLVLVQPGLRGNAGQREDGAERTVTLKVAVDEEFRRQKNWRNEVLLTIRQVSDHFDRQFGIRFEIQQLVPWQSERSAETMYRLLNDLRGKVYQGDLDVVVGFTGQWRPTYVYAGVAAYLRSCILVRRLSPQGQMRKVLIHELGHLFGGVDLDEPGSVMNAAGPGETFDTFTAEIIHINRNREFSPHLFPLPPDKWGEAAEAYKRRKERKKGEFDLNLALATLYLEMGEYDSAIHECEEMLAAGENQPEIYIILGIAYRRKGDPEKALKQYDEFLKMESGLPEIHYNKGIALVNLGMEEEAIREYRKAVELNPFYAKAFSNLALVYLNREEAEKAVLYAQKALEIHPLLAKALTTLGG
ncbi:MAG: tetratricopeptide repeat protein, partial [Acidobacteria bacterium]|nr:tetratricopeptide repeat protein [Acidobacteriota bacterium]